jgi:large subunit ribosomal protein L32
MAVQKSRKTRSKRGMHRSHKALAAPTLSLDPTTGERHLRHSMTKDGYYRGRQIVKPKPVKIAEEETEEVKA